MNLQAGEIISLSYITFSECWLNGVGGSLTGTEFNKEMPGVFFKLQSQMQPGTWIVKCMYAPEDEYQWLSAESPDKVLLRKEPVGDYSVWSIEPWGGGSYALACLLDPTRQTFMEAMVVGDGDADADYRPVKIFLSKDREHCIWLMNRFVSLNQTAGAQMSGHVMQLWQRNSGPIDYCVACDPTANRVFPLKGLPADPPIRQYWTVNLVSDNLYTIKAFQRGPDAYLCGDPNTLTVGLVPDPSSAPGAYWRQSRSTTGFRWSCGDSDVSLIIPSDGSRVSLAGGQANNWDLEQFQTES